MTEIQGLNDFQKCRVFPLTLEEQAREWYWRLKKGSIGNFKELCELFVVHFRGSCIPEQDTSRLKKLVQREFESLRSFVTKYHKEVINLGAFDHPDTLKRLKKGLRINRLWNILYSRGITTYTDTYDQRGWLEIGKEIVKGAERKEISLIGRGREKGNNYERNPWENRVREYNRLPLLVDWRGSRSDHGVNLVEQGGRYIPLNTSITEIYTAIKDKGLLIPPKLIVRGLGGSAHHKYCEFHKVSGHETADCINLKE